MRRHHLLLKVLHCHRDSCLSVKGNSSRDHLVHDNTKGINIAFGIAVTASGLLRGGIMNRAHGHGADGIGGCNLRNTEIGHLHLTFPGNNDILRLDVPVDNIDVMGCLNAHSHLYRNTGGLPHRQLPFSFNIILQSDAFHQLHNDIVNAVLVSHIVHIYHIRMCQTRCSLCLSPELGYKIPVIPEFVLQYLDCHKAVQLVILSFIYIGHSPNSDMGNYLVAVSNEHSFS